MLPDLLSDSYNVSPTRPDRGRCRAFNLATLHRTVCGRGALRRDERYLDDKAEHDCPFLIGTCENHSA